MSTPYRARKRYTERGIAAVHRRNPDRDYERKLNGDEEARLIKLACSDPPEGYSQWSLRLLADELVVLEEIDHNDPGTLCKFVQRFMIRRPLLLVHRITKTVNRGLYGTDQNSRIQVCNEGIQPLLIRPGEITVNITVNT